MPSIRYSQPTDLRAGLAYGDQTDYKDRTLDLREERNAKIAELSERNAFLHSQKVDIQLAQEERKIAQAELQMKHLSGAMTMIDSINPESPQYQAQVAGVIKANPAAFLKSENGEPNGVQQLIGSFNQRHEVWNKANIEGDKFNREIAATTGIDPSGFTKDGRTDWGAHNAAVRKASEAAKLAAGQGLPIKRIETTTAGTNYTFSDDNSAKGDSPILKKHQNLLADINAQQAIVDRYKNKESNKEVVDAKDKIASMIAKAETFRELHPDLPAIENAATSTGSTFQFRAEKPVVPAATGQPTPSATSTSAFASEAEVEAAASEGKIKAGDTVVVNGRKAVWN